MEFKLINPASENGFIKTIDFNFDELKQELTTGLEKYKGLTFTEETVKDAKETRAKLNKFKEAIETKRKDIKNLCLEPYNNFEVKVKELTTLINEPINEIDKQLKAFEDKRIEEKKKAIAEFYNKNIGNLEKVLPLEKISNPKWNNATYKIGNIEKEILEKISEVNGNIKVIDDLKLDEKIALSVKDKYLTTLSLGLAMAEKARLEEIEKNLQEVKKEEIIEAEVVEIEPQEQEPEPEEIEEVEVAPELRTLKIWVKGTSQQLKDLQQFLKDKNIQYGGIN